MSGRKPKTGRKSDLRADLRAAAQTIRQAIGPSGRTMGDVARDLRAAAQTARWAIASGFILPPLTGDDAVSELAQAVVLLARAAERFDSYCGLPSEPKEAG